jgi:hypothetical protein
MNQNLVLLLTISLIFICIANEDNKTVKNNEFPVCFLLYAGLVFKILNYLSLWFIGCNSKVEIYFLLRNLFFQTF